MSAEQQYSVAVLGEGLTAGIVETALQVVAGASKRAEVIRWSVSFNGTDGTKAPVRVELMRQTSAGTSTAYTPKKIDPAGDAPLLTGRTAFTAEPTTDDVLETYYVSPNAGLLVIEYAPDDRPRIAAAGRMAIRLLANDAVSFNAYMVAAE